MRFISFTQGRGTGRLWASTPKDGTALGALGTCIAHTRREYVEPPVKAFRPAAEFLAVRCLVARSVARRCRERCSSARSPRRAPASALRRCAPTALLLRPPARAHPIGNLDPLRREHRTGRDAEPTVAVLAWPRGHRATHLSSRRQQRRRTSERPPTTRSGPSQRGLVGREGDARRIVDGGEGDARRIVNDGKEVHSLRRHGEAEMRRSPCSFSSSIIGVAKCQWTPRIATVPYFAGVGIRSSRPRRRATSSCAAVHTRMCRSCGQRRNTEARRFRASRHDETKPRRGGAPSACVSPRWFAR